MPRAFRSDKSYKAEQITRDMLAQFLKERGFANVSERRDTFGPTSSQRISAVDENGHRIQFWVRLCWRRDGDKKGNATYSAGQLRARIKDGDWVGTVAERVEREKQRNSTHLLMVQRDCARILYAASIPLDAVVPIWKAQRDISASLLEKGLMGRRTKNHAMNGSSPTLWLQDDRAPAVAAALWEFSGVRDIAQITGSAPSQNAVDDSFDDLPLLDYEQLGSDAPNRTTRLTSGVARDPKVRRAVLQRAKRKCERESCGEMRAYDGFLDVHHILGAERSDRVWNCVAICPNCHREAHASPQREELNKALLDAVDKYRPIAASLSA